MTESGSKNSLGLNVNSFLSFVQIVALLVGGVVTLTRFADDTRAVSAQLDELKHETQTQGTAIQSLTVDAAVVRTTVQGLSETVARIEKTVTKPGG